MSQRLRMVLVHLSVSLLYFSCLSPSPSVLSEPFDVPKSISVRARLNRNRLHSLPSPRGAETVLLRLETEILADNHANLYNRMHGHIAAHSTDMHRADAVLGLRNTHTLHSRDALRSQSRSGVVRHGGIFEPNDGRMCFTAGCSN